MFLQQDRRIPARAHYIVSPGCFPSKPVAPRGKLARKIVHWWGLDGRAT